MRQYMQLTLTKDRELALRFAKEIASRAQGVFLWGRLVLNELLDEFTAGDTLHMLTEKLEMLPTELEAYYLRILHHIPAHYRFEVRVMFEVLQSCSHSPTLHDFIHICNYAEIARLADCAPCDTGSLHWTGQELSRLI